MHLVQHLTGNTLKRIETQLSHYTSGNTNGKAGFGPVCGATVTWFENLIRGVEANGSAVGNFIAAALAIFYYEPF